MTVIAQVIKIKPGHPILVEWGDAADDCPSPEGLVWKNLSEAQKQIHTVNVRTVGFFSMYKGKTLFYFTNVDYSVPNEPSIAIEGQIPIGCVTKITLLTESNNELSS